MNIIYERTCVRYHEVHIYRLLHKWLLAADSCRPKVPRKKFVNAASNKEAVQKKFEEIIFQHILQGCTVRVEDDSIFNDRSLKGQSIQ